MMSSKIGMFGSSNPGSPRAGDSNRTKVKLVALCMISLAVMQLSAQYLYLQNQATQGAQQPLQGEKKVVKETVEEIVISSSHGSESQAGESNQDSSEMENIQEANNQQGGLDGEKHETFLKDTCCLNPPCDLNKIFDKWCWGSAKQCQVFPELTRTCERDCVPRWISIDPDHTGSSDTLSMEVVSQCLTSFLHLADNSNIPKVPKPRNPPIFLPTLKSLSEKISFGIQDFPISLISTKHRCSKSSKRPCWKDFYGKGQHYEPRVERSKMAVWAPPVMDQISQLTTKSSGYDPSLHASITKSLGKKKGLVLDVGSNLGVITLFSAGMGHDVISFDPTPWTRHKLHLSLWLNGFTEQVTIVPAGVGSKRGMAHLAMVPGNLGGNQIVRDADDIEKIEKKSADQQGKPDKKGTIPVQIVTLDETLAENEKEIVFIKIDVEGNEIEVLRGATETLKKHKPNMVIETCLWCDPEVLFNLLQGLGYVCGKESAGFDPTPGKVVWDVTRVLQPRRRSQLRPNVFCIHDPIESAKPWDSKLDTSEATQQRLKKFKAFRVEID
eukprot:TRINITY_DN1572_c2_g2_i1.p1 TRINITY_DN1572_c2_g2~~TRINITY_DN1572_c2_g2_i1.p1  ORF type:complete len:566 (+),score=86.36 TRINITY_DN1572_c2_g2_i1:37-1698(+)